MNDSAAQLLGAFVGAAGLGPVEGVAPRLREVLTRKIARRGDVLVWTDSVANAAKAPSIFPDLTGWECADSSFHLEDYVPVSVDTVDEEPRIGENDHQVLLQQGIAFTLQFRRLVYQLDAPTPVRCIVSANETNATFRFHVIRTGDSWNRPDLDDYRPRRWWSSISYRAATPAERTLRRQAEKYR